MFPDVAVRRGSDVDVQSLSCYTVKGKVLTCFLPSYIKQTKSDRVITSFGGIGLPPPYLAYWTLSFALVAIQLEQGRWQSYYLFSRARKEVISRTLCFKL